MAKFLFRIFNFTGKGISNPYIFLCNTIHHYKVLLIPMHNTGKACFFYQLPKRNLYTYRMETKVLRSHTNS